MRIALISLDQCWHDKNANFARCEAFVREAKIERCDLIIFPEMTLTGYSLQIEKVVEPIDSSLTLQRFGNLSVDIGINIIFGACLTDNLTGKPGNMFCLATNDGTSQPIYVKTHPFSFVGEDKVLEAGASPATAEVGALRFNASICYDLRFPELYSLTSRVCNAGVVIANWPALRISHWHALLVARAIENQAFMFGVNRIGKDGNQLVYQKSSQIITPDGKTMVPVLTGEELDIYEIDPEDASRYREKFPTLRDKRHALYRKFLDADLC
jgi:omega-amidase